jgi:hypothetical protein
MDEQIKAAVDERPTLERAEEERCEVDPVGYETPRGYHKVILSKVVNGWIIKIGCCSFVSNSWEEISQGLKEYYDDPRKAEKKYCRGNQC